MNAAADEAPETTPLTEGPQGAGLSRVARRFGPAVVLVLVAAAAWWAGLPHQIVHIADPASPLHAAVARSPAVAMLAYVVLFALLTGACLPVALILTLSSGVLFGPLFGGASTVIGATAAASLTYLAARTALAPSLLARAHRDRRLAKVMDGFGQDTFSYILTMRLIPLFPFSLVNIAAGLAAVPMRAYAGATALGAIPTSFIYASLGSGLGRSVGSEHAVAAAIRSPTVILPLVGLGVLSLAPVAAKALGRRRNST